MGAPAKGGILILFKLKYSMVIPTDALQQPPVCLVIKLRKVCHGVLCPCDSSGLVGTYICSNLLVDTISAFDGIPRRCRRPPIRMDVHPSGQAGLVPVLVKL